MKKSLLIVFCALFFVNSHASAQKLTIAGFTMGMSEQQVIARFKKRPVAGDTEKDKVKTKPYRSTCRESPAKQKTLSDKECTALLPVFATFTFTKFLFFGDELGMMALKFRSLPGFEISHEKIYGIFKAKYGKPSIDNKDKAIWNDSGARIILNKHLNAIGEIELFFVADAFENERARRKNAMTK